MSERAEAALRSALDANLSNGLMQATLRDLSFHYKRQARWDQALELWHQAIRQNHARLYPYVELAKFYEHRAKDFERAEELVVRAIELIQSLSLSRDAWWTQRRLGELEHRLRRVQRKKASLEGKQS